MQPSEQPCDLYCPQCSKRISADETLWTWQNKWYCSEKCVRARMKSMA